MTARQFYAWLGYLVFFLVFYFANSILVNSSRMRDMSEGKNEVLCAVMNGIGMWAFLAFHLIYIFTAGHGIWYESGVDNFLPVVVIIPMVVVLPLAAIYSRKLYRLTGSVYAGALVNAMIFTWIVVGNTCFHFAQL